MCEVVYFRSVFEESEEWAHVVVAEEGEEGGLEGHLSGGGDGAGGGGEGGVNCFGYGRSEGG